MNIIQYLENEPRGRGSELARAISVPAALISQWTTGVRQVPAERVIPLARATDWKVTPHELRPDLYPSPSDGIPVHHKPTEAITQ